MAKYRHLLAKTTKDAKNPCYAETLIGHTQQVIDSIKVLDKTITDSVLPLFAGEILPEYWHICLFCSAWFHDLGKANDHFQKRIRDRKFRQGIRHEALSLIVVTELLAGWLQKLWDDYPRWVQAAVFFAISGHHLKFPENKERGHSEVVFLGQHPQMAELLAIGQQRFQLDNVPELPDQTYSLLDFACGGGSIGDKLHELRRQWDLDFSEPQKLFIAAIKSTLMAADIAGSALPDKTANISSWLKEHLQTELQPGELRNVVTQKIQEQPLRPFQQQIQTQDSNTVLLEAGCGSGKTLAAYLWAAAHNCRRLFICYPTTATASEGFGGYLHEPDFPAILIHSRASTDYRLLENMPPRTPSELELQALKLEALETWPIPVTVCTVHTVLGLLQNMPRGLHAWPALTRAVFVFDEIHSFSDKLFQHLLRFIEIFHRVPMLLMTATLPRKRRQAIETACRNRSIISLQGPQNRENAKRYLLRRVDDQEAWQTATETLHNGGKVLWVCNTINRAMQCAKRAHDDELPVEPYHSRYRYQDRVTRHNKVVNGFKTGRPAMLAITTQVAEMSLDLSADLLISEYAPIPSLIQRMGRLNRHEDEPEQVKPALFIKPEDPLPYAKKTADDFWLDIERWLDRVADGAPKSQLDLAEVFCEIEERGSDDGPLPPFPQCDWLDKPWESQKYRHSIMEAGYTIELIRQEDVDRGTPAEMAIPMPFPGDKSWNKWERRGRYLIAPRGTIRYNDFWGAQYATEKANYWIVCSGHDASS